MEHSIVDFAPFTVIGLGVDCPGYDGSGIGECWMQFNQRTAELPAGGKVWGVSLPRVNGFYYIAGHQVPHGTPVPEAMEEADVPGASYIKVHFHDHPSQMPGAFSKIFGELLPAEGLLHATGPVCLEEYGLDWHEEAAGKFNMDLFVQLA